MGFLFPELVSDSLFLRLSVCFSLFTFSLVLKNELVNSILQFYFLICF